MDPVSVASLTVSLFFILNPFASLPLFISVTRGLDVKVRNSYANKAVLVAAVLLLVFVFVGNDLMGIVGVTMDSFRVAGGIVLLMMAIELVFGLKLAQMDDRDGASWAIIASPVLTGPGMITAAVLFANQYGLVTVVIASILALFLTWMILRLSDRILHIVGEQAIGMVTKVIGLLIAAMGIENMFSGSLGWFEAHTVVASAIVQFMVV